MQSPHLGRAFATALLGTALLTGCADEGPPLADHRGSSTTEETTTTTDGTTTTEQGGPGGTTGFHAEDLVGQPVDGDALGALLASSTWEIDGGHYKLLYDGIELAVDQGLGVSAVFLYAQGRADFDEYRGTLPFDMYWGEPWSAIEARFGEPTQMFGPGEYDDTFSVQYGITDMPYATLDLYFSPGDGSPESTGLVQATFSTT